MNNFYVTSEMLIYVSKFYEFTYINKYMGISVWVPVCGWAGVLFASMYLPAIPVAVMPHGRLIKQYINIGKLFGI